MIVDVFQNWLMENRPLLLSEEYDTVMINDFLHDWYPILTDQVPTNSNARNKMNLIEFHFSVRSNKNTYRETHRTRNVEHLRNSSTISASIHEDSSIINRCYLSRASIWRTDLLIILKVGKYDNVRVYNIQNANISFCSPNILGRWYTCCIGSLDA